MDTADLLRLLMVDESDQSVIHPSIHQMIDPKPGGTTPYLCSATADDGRTSLAGKVTVGPLKLQRRNV